MGERSEVAQCFLQSSSSFQVSCIYGNNLQVYNLRRKLFFFWCRILNQFRNWFSGILEGLDLIHSLLHLPHPLQQYQHQKSTFRRFQFREKKNEKKWRSWIRSDIYLFQVPQSESGVKDTIKVRISDVQFFFFVLQNDLMKIDWYISMKATLIPQSPHAQVVSSLSRAGLVPVAATIPVDSSSTSSTSSTRGGIEVSVFVQFRPTSATEISCNQPDFLCCFQHRMVSVTPFTSADHLFPAEVIGRMSRNEKVWNKFVLFYLL